MMGHRQVEQAALFYEFSLERYIPMDHVLRSIDRFVELGDLRRELAPFYSSMGRPSIDPELMIRMLIVGYCFGIKADIGPKANWQTIVFGSNLRFRVNQVANKQPNGQEVAMSERYNLELISRRRAFSFLGSAAAALSVAVPATVLIATDAEARVGNPGSAVSVAGANRRDRRQDRRYKKTPTTTTPTTTGQGEKK